MKIFSSRFLSWRMYKKTTVVLFMLLVMITTIRHMKALFDRTKTPIEPISKPKDTQVQKAIEDIDRKSTLEIKRNSENHFENYAGDLNGVNVRLTRKTRLPPFNKYWAEILHFVPEEDNQDCLNLFTTRSSTSMTLTSEWEHVTRMVQMSKFRSKFAPQHIKLTLMYQELARLDFVHTVCEIGFNVGQSAIAWLTAKPDINLYSFDIGGELPEKMGQELEKLFPHSFQLIIGDSRKTVPQWIEQGVKCDILFIDGGHTHPIVRSDILNMKKAAAKEHIIVLDDIYYPGVNKAWKEQVQKGVVHHLFDCWIKGYDIDFALGYYKNIHYNNGV